MSFDPNAIAQEVVEAAVRAAQNSNTDNTPGPRFALDEDKARADFQALVEPLFSKFTSIPDPSSYESVITDLTYAMHYLSYSGAETTDPINKQPITANVDLGAISSAADELYTWDGEAAKNFKTKFLDKLPGHVTNQFLILGVLKGATEADREVWKQTREDLEDIKKKTVSALDAVGGCPPDGFTFTLTVIGAVVTIAAVPFTAGASAVAAGVGSSLLAAASTAAVTEESIEANVGSPDQILRSMSDAIEKLCQQVRDKQSQIGEVLAAYAGETAQNDTDATTGTPYVPPSPRLASMEGGELTSNEGVGKPD